MIRKSTINLKFANTGKLEQIRVVAEEYQRVVNLFIGILWEQKQFFGNFVKDSSIESWLSARLKQAAAKQALSIVKSQRKKKKKTKPTLNRLVMELDSRFVDIKQDINYTSCANNQCKFDNTCYHIGAQIIRTKNQTNSCGTCVYDSKKQTTNWIPECNQDMFKQDMNCEGGSCWSKC